jgi:hypothetical protein
MYMSLTLSFGGFQISWNRGPRYPGVTEGVDLETERIAEQPRSDGEGQEYRKVKQGRDCAPLNISDDGRDDAKAFPRKSENFAQASLLTTTHPGSRNFAARS